MRMVTSKHGGFLRAPVVDRSSYSMRECGVILGRFNDFSSLLPRNLDFLISLHNNCRFPGMP